MSRLQCPDRGPKDNEGLSRRRKDLEEEHLGACIGSSTPPEADQHLYPDKTATSLPIDAAPPMARPIQATTREHPLLHHPSYGCLWRAPIQATAARGAHGRVVIIDTQSLLGVR